MPDNVTAPSNVESQHTASTRVIERGAGIIEVTIVMPCLNEVESLPHCIANAGAALQLIEEQFGLLGEIVVADNGSTDGSQSLASSLGARVVAVPRRGYGAALIGGCNAARGRFIIIGDCDGSYDFTEGVAMVDRLRQGHDVCMGSRFRGQIARNAMPWKNRYIGNPALTGILNLFFRANVSDAHSGLRAMTREAFQRLQLRGSGMEFASEMVIKASLLKLKMTEVPVTLSPDLRKRAPHLRPWRDGWRHLRYILMLSPTWLFGVPACLAIGVGLIILCTAIAHALGGWIDPIAFGESWIVIGAMLTSVGHMSGMMALASHVYGVGHGYRLPKPWLQRLGRILSLDSCIVAGLVLLTVSIAGLAIIGVYWGREGFGPLPSILPVALAGLVGTIGLQTMMGGFLLAVTGGNEADFLDVTDVS